ncbi:MAG TPA: riboflavin synthase [bacterium]|nr:riboflavin synthase [bacterium]HOL34775.1 riboflavin synthase [bacterium]HPP07766.1 riboflavin synthase [bacterium]
MFSGIIEEKGIVVEKKPIGQTSIIGISAVKVFDDLQQGDSISVDGVCLTVEKITQHIFYATISYETMKLTTLGQIRIGTRVNLERALKYGDRVGGHFLLGHIDFTGTLSGKKDEKDHYVIRIQVPAPFIKYFVRKCSVGIDGISLTVADITGNQIIVWLIPYTVENTTIGEKRVGDRVNVETDVIVKSAIEGRTYREKHEINKEAIF